MAKGMAVLAGLPVNCIWNGRSDLQAGVEIYHWMYPGFWLILSSQNDPVLGPQFHPPRVVNWRPHISMPTGDRDLISRCALRRMSEVLPPILWAIGCALAGQAKRGNDAIFGDFGIMTPLDEPVVP